MGDTLPKPLRVEICKEDAEVIRERAKEAQMSLVTYVHKIVRLGLKADVAHPKRIVPRYPDGERVKLLDPYGEHKSGIYEAISLLSLVFEVMPSEETLSSLSTEELESITRWAAGAYVEANGSSEARVGPVPKCLRDLLPHDHFYKNWRVYGPDQV